MLISVLLCSVTMMAQKAERDSIGNEFDLEQVVVTGTRTPKMLKDTPVYTRLITRNDIQKTDATNIKDLLQQELPGVEFSYAMNQQSHLNFAGFGGQSILFLVDGERLAGEAMDDVDFARLNMDNVERIEIARGAVSALYGSNAGGGVINIITKDASKPFSLNLNGRYAKHNNWRYGGSIGLNGNGVQNLFSLNHNSIDNYDVTSAPNPVTRVITTIYGDRVWNIKDQLSYKFKPFEGLGVVKLTAKAGYFFRETVRTIDQPERYRDFSGGLRGQWDINQKNNIELGYSFDQYDKSDFQRITKLDIRDYSNVQNSFRGLYNHSLREKDILTFGFDYMHDYLFNPNLKDERRQQDCFDLFGQYDCVISPKWELVGALRYDYLSDDHTSRVTPKISARYIPARNLNIRFGYGMGFRAPSLKEKYYNFDMAGIWIVEGNPNLKAETSHLFNASVEYTRSNYNLSLNTYYNNVTNKLANAAPHFKTPEDKLPYLPYTNLPGYSVYGGDMSFQARWNNGIGFRFSYALTKEELPKDRDGNTINNQYIPARTHSITLRVDYDRQFTKNYGLYASINGRWLSSVENKEYADYYDISKGTVTVKYPPYSIWKLQLVHRLWKKVKITMALDNILNYKPKYYYLNCPLTDGINLQIGASFDI